MSFTLGGAGGLVCIGLLARDVGIPAAWLASAAVFVLLAPGFILLGRLARDADAATVGVKVVPTV
jgi:hypothetical protein